jgi:hypothetical protein
VEHVSHLEQPRRAIDRRRSPFRDLNANDSSGIIISQEHLGQPIELATKRRLRATRWRLTDIAVTALGMVPDTGRERLVENLIGFPSGS